MTTTGLILLALLTASLIAWLYRHVKHLEDEREWKGDMEQALAEARRQRVLDRRRACPEPLDRDGRPHCLTGERAWYHRPETIAARRKRLLDDPTIDQAIMEHWITLKPFDDGTD